MPAACYTIIVPRFTFCDIGSRPDIYHASGTYHNAAAIFSLISIIPVVPLDHNILQCQGIRYVKDRRTIVFYILTGASILHFYPIPDRMSVSMDRLDPIHRNAGRIVC